MTKPDSSAESEIFSRSDTEVSYFLSGRMPGACDVTVTLQLSRRNGDADLELTTQGAPPLLLAIRDKCLKFSGDQHPAYAIAGLTGIMNTITIAHTIGQRADPSLWPSMLARVAYHIAFALGACPTYASLCAVVVPPGHLC